MRETRNEWSLAEFQTQFMRSFFAPEDNKLFINAITPGGSLADGATAIRIHHNGYVCRLTDALGEIYEGVWSVLGDKNFFAVCADYIKNHPSIFYNLADYGQTFAEFLKSTPYHQEFSFLSSLARFEHAFHEAFHARDHHPITPHQLAEIETSPFSILRFGPSVQLLALEHSVYELWKTRKRQNRIVENYNATEQLVLYKRNGQIFVQYLSARAFSLLEALHSGISFGRYLDDPLSKRLEAKDISDVFFLITSAGLIEAIHPGTA